MSTYKKSLEQRRMYRDNEVSKHGLFALNRLNAWQRAKRKGAMTPQTFKKYEFTSDEIEGIRIRDFRANCDLQDYICHISSPVK